MDLPDPKVGCHHTGFAKKCRDLVTKGICNRWIAVQGEKVNTGVVVNHYDCVDNWLPALTLEAAKQSRIAGASSDKVADEVSMLHRTVAQSRVSHTPPERIVDHNTYGPFENKR